LAGDILFTAIAGVGITGDGMSVGIIGVGTTGDGMSVGIIGVGIGVIKTMDSGILISTVLGNPHMDMLEISTITLMEDVMDRITTATEILEAET
jgi:hypothetical protein